MAEDLTSVDFFRDSRLTDDPYPFYEALRNKCPVSREDHYGVTMVTGWQEAVDVYNDAETFSSCISVTGPFPGFPVPLEGDDVTELIVKHRDEIPFSDQLPTLDPPTHTNHRALLMRLITPKRLKENEDAMWAARRRHPRRLPGPGRGRVHQGLRGPVHAAGHRRPAGRARRRPPRAPRAARARHPRRRAGQRREDDEQDPAGVPLRGLRDVRRRARARTARRRADRAGDGDLPGRDHARGRRRRAGGHQRLLGRPGNDGAAAQHRAEGDRRPPRHPAQAARGPQPPAELHRGVPAHREPGQGRLPAVAGADHRRRGGRRRRHAR